MALMIRPDSGINVAFDIVIGKGGNLDQSVWANEMTQASLVIDFRWTDWITGQVQREVLGYPSILGGVGNKKLSRKIPMPHPYFGNRMHAVKISNAQGFKPLAVDAQGKPRYERVRCVVIYEPLPYRVLTDDQLNEGVFAGKEYNRYTQRVFGTTSEFISRKGNHFKWAQGALAGPPAQPISFDVPQRLMKIQLSLTWTDVPARGLFGDALLGDAPKQTQMAGMVNDNLFMGWPKETLLALAPEFRPKQAPFRSARAGTADPEELFDVVFMLLGFDPDTAIDPAVARGHNVVPVPQTGLWALVTDTGAVGGQRIYGSYNYELGWTLNG